MTTVDLTSQKTKLVLKLLNIYLFTSISINLAKTSTSLYKIQGFSEYSFIGWLFHMNCHTRISMGSLFGSRYIRFFQTWKELRKTEHSPTETFDLMWKTSKMKVNRECIQVSNIFLKAMTWQLQSISVIRPQLQHGRCSDVLCL